MVLMVHSAEHAMRVHSRSPVLVLRWQCEKRK